MAKETDAATWERRFHQEKDAYRSLLAEDKRLHLILSVIDLPYVLISKYEHKSHFQNGEWTGYAAVIKEARDSYDNWCHRVVDGVSPWHCSEDEAWACFDTNHPGLREALASLGGTGY